MARMFLTKLIFIVAVIAISSQSAVADERSGKEKLDSKLISYPLSIDRKCRKGKAKIFDECTDQVQLFNIALKRAKKDGKVLLVSYGAEWCIWCHVFEAYVHGKADKFTYTYGSPGKKKRWTDTLYERAKTGTAKRQAKKLKQFVGSNFVLVHIDYEHAPRGDDVVINSGAADHYGGNIPFVFSVNEDGVFAAAFDESKAEIRRDTDDWYRGYDRAKLKEQLYYMKQKAIAMR